MGEIDGGHDGEDYEGDGYCVGQDGSDGLVLLAEEGHYEGRYQGHSHENGQRYAHPFSLLISVMSKVPYLP